MFTIHGTALRVSLQAALLVTWSLAAQGAEARNGIPALLEKLQADDPDVVRAARTALETIAHHASRPGAAEEREQVAGAVASACSAAEKPEVKNILLEILGFVGTGKSVPVVAECLDVPETHRMACFALARIEAPEAAAALRDTLSDSASRPDSRQIALLGAIGRKNDIAAAYLLSDLAGSASSDEVHLATLDALSRNPMAYAYVHVFWDALPPADSEEQQGMRARVWDCFLRVGAAFIGMGEVGAASDLYCELLDNAAGTAEKCGAILGLGLAGRRDAPARVFEMLGEEEPEIRAATLEALETMRLGGFYAGVGKALAKADPTLQVSLLRVLGSRTEPQAGPIIVSYLDHAEARVRAAALGALERKADEYVAETLIQAIAERSPITGEGALLVLRRLADSRSIDVLKSCLDVPDLRLEAAAALLHVALELEGDRKQTAVDLLETVLPLVPTSPAALEALARLRSLGVACDLARNAGFVTRWWLLGPVPAADGELQSRDLVDPKTARGGNGGSVKVGDRTLEWKLHATTDPLGVVNLHAAVAAREQVGALACAEVTAPRSMAVTLRLGSDDDIVCWLNGKKIHAFEGSRGSRADQDLVPVELEAGTNRLLLEVVNRTGDWDFCVRITGSDGVPVVLDQGGTEKNSTGRPGGRRP